MNTEGVFSTGPHPVFPERTATAPQRKAEHGTPAVRIILQIK